MIWITFLISAALIIVAGMKLTAYADVISDRLKLGRALVGVILLGLVTSLPEAITTIYSVVTLFAHDLAVGNILGSNNFNPLVFVILDAVYRKEALTNRVQFCSSHLKSYWTVMLLSVLVGLELLFKDMPYFGPMSVTSILIIIVYIFGVRAISCEMGEDERPEQETKESMGWVVLKLIISAAVVVGSAMALASAADRIAEMTGLGRTFVGSIFLAFVTSLPEIVVSLTALRMKAIDLAVGNIFGSNMINIFILVVCSLFAGTPILLPASQTHLVTLILSMILVTIGICGIKLKQKKQIAGLGIDSWLMLIFFLVGTGFLYSLK